MTTTTDRRVELTVQLCDAVALLDLYELIEDPSPQERAAGERLRYQVRGALVGGHCPDCDAGVGATHHKDCEIAVCWWTGLERARCDYGHPHAETPGGFDFGDPADRCGTDRWTGVWPAVDDAHALGFWCYTPKGRPAVRCDENDARARPDFERLRTDARWDRDQRRWIARS